MPRRPLRGRAGGRLLTLPVARHQWEEGARRLAAAQSDPARYRALAAVVDSVTDELRRRVGQTFTLEQLAAAYAGAEQWSRDAAASGAPETGRPEDLATVEDAAFHLYARGAIDYIP